MFIDTVKVKILQVPLAKAFTTNLHTLSSLSFLVLYSHTTAGITANAEVIKRYSL